MLAEALSAAEALSKRTTMRERLQERARSEPDVAAVLELEAGERGGTRTEPASIPCHGLHAKLFRHLDTESRR